MRFLSMIGGIAVVMAIATGIWWWINNLTLRSEEKKNIFGRNSKENK